MLNEEQLPEPVDRVFDDWQLTPEGAAIHRRQPVAVVADLHLGYEWARGAAGDSVIAHSLDETLSRLALVLGRAPVSRLVVAGDLVESPRPCSRTAPTCAGCANGWKGGASLCWHSKEIMIEALLGPRSSIRGANGRWRPPARLRVGRSVTATGRSAEPGQCRDIITQCFGSRGLPPLVFSWRRIGSFCRPCRPMRRAATLPRPGCQPNGEDDHFVASSARDRNCSILACSSSYAVSFESFTRSAAADRLVFGTAAPNLSISNKQPEPRTMNLKTTAAPQLAGMRNQGRRNRYGDPAGGIGALDGMRFRVVRPTTAPGTQRAGQTGNRGHLQRRRQRPDIH